MLAQFFISAHYLRKLARQIRNVWPIDQIFPVLPEPLSTLFALTMHVMAVGDAVNVNCDVIVH